MSGAGRLQQKLRARQFVLTAEITPPDAASAAAVLSKVEGFGAAVDAVNVTDGAGARAHMSAFAASAVLAQAGIEPVLQLTVRDRNRLAIEGDLIGAPALGIPNILCLHGDAIDKGDQPETKAVWDIDSRSVMAMARQLRDNGTLPSGRAVEPRPQLFIGAADAPREPGPSLSLDGLAAKIAAGADFFQTQFVFDLAMLERYLGSVRDAGLLERTIFIVGVGIVSSAKSARWMNEALFGVHIPDTVIDRLDKASDQAREGRRIACEIIEALRTMRGVSGAHLMAPGGAKAISGVLAEMRVPANLD